MWLKVEQGYEIHLGTLVLGKLLYPTFSLPNAVTPQPLEPCNCLAYFDEVGFSSFRVGWSCNEGSPEIAKLSSSGWQPVAVRMIQCPSYDLLVIHNSSRATAKWFIQKEAGSFIKLHKI